MLRPKFHPETEIFLRLLREHSLVKSGEEYTPEHARKELENATPDFAGEATFNGDINDIHIPSDDLPDGIPTTVYIPEDDGKNPPILVYFHGGGMVIGSRASVDTTCRRISMETPCIVANVEYRLAPEYRFPASFIDAEVVVRWVLRNKCRVGGSDRSRVGVGGDSAGGTLTATMCHLVPGIAFQILVYPAVNYRPGPLRKSAEEYRDGPILSNDVVLWYRGHFLINMDTQDIRLNPFFRDRFDHLPPALFIIAQCDRVRDQSYDYEAKLKEAGVETKLLLVEGACHSFFTKPGVFKECCDKAYGEVTKFLRKFIPKS